MRRTGAATRARGAERGVADGLRHARGTRSGAADGARCWARQRPREASEKNYTFTISIYEGGAGM